MKDRIRTWLMAHPGVLALLFLLMAKGSEYVPDGVTTSGNVSGTLGP